MENAEALNTIGAVKFSDVILRYESLIITAATWTIIQAFRKLFKKASQLAAVARFEPLAAIFISVPMAFMPTFRLGDWDETLLYGVILGSFCGLGHKVLKQSIFGMDSRIHESFIDEEDEDVGRKRLKEKIKKLVT